MRWIYVLCLMCVVCGCGGGSSSRSAPAPTTSPPPPPTSTGRFVDTRVEGLTYLSGQAAGVTDEQGQFLYEQSADITFSIGGIVLGTAPGADLITPLDLVANGTSVDTSVLNRVRLLLLLDDDGDANNGIRIIEALTTVAEGWENFDFEADFVSSVSPIIADIEMALNRSVEIPNEASAQSHLEASVACLASGVYAGRFAGDDSGPFLLWIQSSRFDPLNFGDALPRTGVTSALAYSEPENLVIGVAPQQGLSFDSAGNFVSGNTSTGAEFQGQLLDYVTIANGAWSNPTFGENGTFSGERLAGDITARYRLSGFFAVGGTFTPQTTGVIALDVFADQRVVGTATNLLGDEMVMLSGTLDDEVIEVSAGDLTISLNFDADGTDPDNDLALGTTQGFLGAVAGGPFDQADVIGTSCQLN